MHQLMYFFRNIDLSREFSSYSWIHFVLLSIWVLGCLWFWLYRQRWCGGYEKRLSWLLKRILLMSLLLYFCCLLWLQNSECLPIGVYTLAQICLLFDHHQNRIRHHVFAVTIGFGCSVFILLLPQSLLYVWPHLLTLTFYMSVMATGWLSFIGILEVRKTWAFQTFLNGMVFLILYEMVLVVFNIWQNTNYDFLLKAPDFCAFTMKEIIYAPMMIIIYTVAYGLMSYIISKIQTKNCE